MRNHRGARETLARLLHLLYFSGTLSGGYLSFRAACRFAANSVVSQLSSTDADEGGCTPSKGNYHDYTGDCGFRSERV